jgi:hypothetical protein
VPKLPYSYWELTELADAIFVRLLAF